MAYAHQSASSVRLESSKRAM